MLWRHPLDPSDIVEPAPDEVRFICLSDKCDVHVALDYQDYLWAREIKWGHTYGSGSMVEEYEGVFVIQRPDHMYANYRPFGGKARWLHKEVCERAYGPPRGKATLSDHKNGQTLDCRRCNLHWATHSDNSLNRSGSYLREQYVKEVGRVLWL